MARGLCVSDQARRTRRRRSCRDGAAAHGARGLASSTDLAHIRHKSVISSCQAGAHAYPSEAVTSRPDAYPLPHASHAASLLALATPSGVILMIRPAATSADAVKRLRRRPYRYALALVLVGASLIALVLLYADKTVSLRDKFTQIGAGLAASIIFAVIYTILANREYAELIRAEIADQLTNHLNDVLHQIKQLNLVFLPTDQYPAAKEFDPRFNRDLTRDLCHSSFYFFRGTSAKYIPARLQVCDHHLESVQVILLDPRDSTTIEARATDRRKRPEYQGKTLEVIESEIRAEILLGFVALFDCREQCEIEVGFTVGTSPVRIEVFDDAIYTSMYKSAESQRNTHPETVRFSKDSQTYQIFRDECRRQMQLAASRRRFTPHDSDRELCEFIASLGFGALGPAELEEQRQKYRTFIAPFSNALARTEAMA